MSRTADEIAVELAAAETALASIRTSISDDPAIARISGALLVKAGRVTDSALRRYNDQLATVGNLTGALVRARRREPEAQRRRLTADDVRGAAMVRDRNGWHKVVRVSAKSVNQPLRSPTVIWDVSKTKESLEVPTISPHALPSPSFGNRPPTFLLVATVFQPLV